MSVIPTQSLDWVAGKEFNLSYDIGETISNVVRFGIRLFLGLLLIPSKSNSAALQGRCIQ